MKTRREFIKSTSFLAAASLAVRPSLHAAHHEKWFDISLAQWSLHRAFRGGEKDAMDILKSSYNIVVTCDYCQHEYSFDKSQVLGIFSDKK